MTIDDKTILQKYQSVTDQWNVVNLKLMTIMKDTEEGESWKVGKEAFIF